MEKEIQTFDLCVFVNIDVQREIVGRFWRIPCPSMTCVPSLTDFFPTLSSF